MLSPATISAAVNKMNRNKIDEFLWIFILISAFVWILWDLRNALLYGFVTNLRTGDLIQSEDNEIFFNLVVLLKAFLLLIVSISLFGCIMKKKSSNKNRKKVKKEK